MHSHYLDDINPSSTTCYKINSLSSNIACSHAAATQQIPIHHFTRANSLVIFISCVNGKLNLPWVSSSPGIYSLKQARTRPAADQHPRRLLAALLLLTAHIDLLKSPAKLDLASSSGSSPPAFSVQSTLRLMHSFWSRYGQEHAQTSLATPWQSHALPLLAPLKSPS